MGYLLGFLALMFGAAQLPAQATADKDNGKKVYEKIGCWQCHGYSGQGGAAGAVLTATKLNAQGVIRYVRRPGGVMPAYTEKVVSDQELTDVFTYIKSLPPSKTVDQIPALKSLRDAK